MKKRNFIQWFLPAMLLVLINILVYWPSLFHAARGDQISFLKNTAGISSLNEMFKEETSYTRAPTTQRGDEFLFRPLFFVALILQRWWYGCQFWKWQLTAIMIHILVLFQMRRLLSCIGKSYLSWLFIANFSIFYLGQEMVIWHHISIYMLSVLCLIEVFLYFLCYLYFPQKDPLALWKCAFFLTMTSLIFEFGLVVNLLMIFSLLAIRSGWIAWLETRRRSVLWSDLFILGIPILSCMILNGVDYYLHHLRFYHNFLPTISGSEFILRFFGTIFLFIDATLFPVFIQIKPLGRSLMEFPDWSRIHLQMAMHPWLAAMNFLMILLIFIFFIKAITTFKKSSSLEHFKPNDKELSLSISKTMGWLTLTLALAYVVMLVVGRSRSPFFYIQISLYHFYIIELLLSICAFSFWTMSQCLARDKKDPLINLLSGILIISILLNANESFKFNSDLKKKYWPWARFMTSLDYFVMSHRKEPDFSFDVIWRPSAANLERLRRGGMVYRYQYQPYFTRFLNKKDPKYLVTYFLTDKDRRP